jgi:hypothetical protein
MQINVRKYRRGNTKNGQSREAGYMWYSRQRKTKRKHNTQVPRKGKKFLLH